MITIEYNGQKFPSMTTEAARLLLNAIDAIESGAGSSTRHIIKSTRRSMRLWTDSDLMTLRSMRGSKPQASYKDVGKSLGRTPGAVNAKAVSIGI